MLLRRLLPPAQKVEGKGDYCGVEDKLNCKHQEEGLCKECVENIPVSHVTDLKDLTGPWLKVSTGAVRFLDDPDVIEKQRVWLKKYGEKVELEK